MDQSRLRMDRSRLRVDRSRLRMDQSRLRMDRSRLHMDRPDCTWIGPDCVWTGPDSRLRMDGSRLCMDRSRLRIYETFPWWPSSRGISRRSKIDTPYIYTYSCILMYFGEWIGPILTFAGSTPPALKTKCCRPQIEEVKLPDVAISTFLKSCLQWHWISHLRRRGMAQSPPTGSGNKSCDRATHFELPVSCSISCGAIFVLLALMDRFPLQRFSWLNYAHVWPMQHNHNNSKPNVGACMSPGGLGSRPLGGMHAPRLGWQFMISLN
jgi:hypothetical protein